MRLHFLTASSLYVQQNMLKKFIKSSTRCFKWVTYVKPLTMKNQVLSLVTDGTKPLLILFSMV